VKGRELRLVLPSLVEALADAVACRVAERLEQDWLERRHATRPMTLREASEMIGVSTGTVKTLISKGVLVPLDGTRKIYLPAAQVWAYAEGRQR
jgi:hypothetical protein